MWGKIKSRTEQGSGRHHIESQFYKLSGGSFFSLMEYELNGGGQPQCSWQVLAMKIRNGVLWNVSCLNIFFENEYRVTKDSRSSSLVKGCRARIINPPQDCLDAFELY